MILCFELLLVLMGVLLGYDHGVYLAISGYLIGFLLPIALYRKFNAKNLNFPHLVERSGLIVIVAFGEAIVNLTNYLNSKTPLIYAILLFLSLTMMFANYVIFSEKIIDHHQLTKGFVLMYSHVFIIVAILMMTAATIYLDLKGMNTDFVASFLIASMAIYYIAILFNKIYSKKSCKFDLKNLALYLLIFVAASIAIFIWQTNLIVIISTWFVWNLLYLILLAIKVNQI